MKNYIYDNMWTQELEDMIENDKAKPLIMEMFYKHGFRVYDAKAYTDWNQTYAELKEEDYTQERRTNKFMLTLDGLPYCQVYVDEVAQGKIEYCFYSPYFEKERGKDSIDKKTIRSAKISGLMRMLEKYNCVQDSPEKIITSDNMHYIPSAVASHLIRNSGLPSKPIHSQSQQYEVLEAYMTGKQLTVEKEDELKKLFDIWAKEVETERHAVSKVQLMFGNEFYLVVETGSDGICYGKLKFNFDKDSVRGANYEVTDSFQRVKSMDDVDDELKSALTMYKIWSESNVPEHYRTKGQIICSDTGYIKDLEMVVTSGRYGSDVFSMRLLAIPLETE